MIFVAAVVQSLSCLTFWDPQNCSISGLPVPHYLPEFSQVHVHWINDTIQPSHPVSCSSPFTSIKVFSSEFTIRIRWPEYWSFIFNISLTNEYSGLTSLRTDWFDILAVQGTLKSLLQHCNLKALILRCSAFFMVQLSHPFMTTGKTIALTIQTFFSKVIPLLFFFNFRLCV